MQLIERNLGFDDAGITNNSTLFSQFTGDVNTSLDKALSIILGVGGTWQFDDSNHTDYPIITTNIILGQRDYSFTVDGNSNLILEIQKVFVSDVNGNFNEVLPVDVASGMASPNYWNGLDTQGLPNSYEKNATGIFLDPIPNYNKTGGLKIYISREGSYFSITDTTKKPGIAGLFHEYLALRPSYQYAIRKELPTANAFEREMLKMEDAMMEYYKAREKDVVKVITPRVNNSR